MSESARVGPLGLGVEIHHRELSVEIHHPHRLGVEIHHPHRLGVEIHQPRGRAC